MASYSETPNSSASLSLSPPFVNTYMASFSEQEIKEWNFRSDVLYHFHAYRYFSKGYPNTGVDLVNLDDADVQFYNRTSMMTRGLSISNEAAAYLSEFALKYPVDAANTHRKRFICHVREYNMGSDTRRRFYMLSLSEEEAEFLKNLPSIPASQSKVSFVSFESVGDPVRGCDDKENIEDGSKVVAKNIGEVHSGAVDGIDTIIHGANNFLTNTPSSKDLKLVTKSTTQSATSFSWATDGCQYTHVNADEVKEQEQKVEELIQECLHKYQEKKASNKEDFGVKA